MLTKSQEKALNELRKGENVHLYGEGGTGKSFLINKYLGELPDSERYNTLITAPTGIAAININGVTIHRTFGIPIMPLGPHDNPPAKVSDVLKKATRVIIDEISMCRFDVFEYLTKCIRLAEKEYSKKIQVIVIGDMLQLPPVITDKDREALEKLWGRKIVNGFAYNSPLWNSYNFKNCYLNEIMRQQGDLELIDNNNKARIGDITCIKWFNSLNNKPGNNAIHLCPKNKDADTINESAINEFDKVTKFFSTIEGKVNNTDKPVPDIVSVAVGMKVMVVVNGEGYFNGQIGIIENVSYNHVVVNFNGLRTSVEPHEWNIEEYIVKTNYEGKTYLDKEIVGKYRQLPLKPAYAITIHKSQGQTYDEVIIHPNCFAAGQLYVAISRCKNRKGLCFYKKIKESNLIADPDSIAFYEKITNSKKEGRGGARKGAGRKALYGKGVKMTTMKVPESAVEEIKAFLLSKTWE